MLLNPTEYPALSKRGIYGCLAMAKPDPTKDPKFQQVVQTFLTTPPAHRGTRPAKAGQLPRRLLPRSEWTVHCSDDCLIVGAHERGGYRSYTKVRLSNASNDLVCFDDLERIVVDKFDVATVGEK